MLVWVFVPAGRPASDDSADDRFNFFDTCLSVIEAQYDVSCFFASHGIAFPEYVGCDALSAVDAAATWPRYLARIERFAEALPTIVVMVVCREKPPGARPPRGAQRTTLEDRRFIPTALSAGRHGIGIAPLPVTAQGAGSHGGVGVSSGHSHHNLPTAAGGVTCSKVFVPLILEAVELDAGPASRASILAAANAINGHTAGLWDQLVHAYRADFDARGIARVDISNLLVFGVTRRRDYIHASEQERLLNPADNGGESLIGTVLYQRLCLAALAWLAPPAVARPPASGESSAPEAPQRLPILLLGEIL